MVRFGDVCGGGCDRGFGAFGVGGFLEGVWDSLVHTLYLFWVKKRKIRFVSIRLWEV